MNCLKTKTQGAKVLMLCVALLLTAKAGAQDATQKEKLTEITNELYAQKNDNFILVKAYNDGLIKEATRYDFRWEYDKVTLNEQILPEPKNSEYTELFRSYLLKKQGNDSSWLSLRGDGVKLTDIYNRESWIWRDRKPAENNTTQAPVPPTPKAHEKRVTDKLLAEIAKDKLADTTQHVKLEYNNKGITINDKPLAGKQLAKYKKMLQKEDVKPVANNDSYSAEWNP